MRRSILADRYHLSPFDTNVLLICLAAELDLRYERLYAYLQDDVSKKRPTVDLALNLCCESFDEKLKARERFSASAPIVAPSIAVAARRPRVLPRAPLLNRYLKVDERIVAYLLDDDEIDERLTPYVPLVNPRRGLEELILSEEMRDCLSRLLQIREGDRDGMNGQYFVGPYGVGKKSVAEALCKIAGSRLLIVDGVFPRMPEVSHLGGTHRSSSAKRTCSRYPAIYWSGFDTLLAGRSLAVARKVLPAPDFQEWDGMVFLCW